MKPRPEEEMTEKDVKPGSRTKLKNWWERNRIWFAIIGLIFLFLFVFFAKDVWIALRPGERGVYWYRLFGTDLKKSYGEGTVLVLPWDELHVYDTRLQQINGQNTLLSADGLPIALKWSARFHPSRESLPLLHQEIGPDYVERFLLPATISAIRKVIGNYSAEQIYARDEEGLLEEILETLVPEAEVRNVFVRAVLVKELRLPQEVEMAIGDKLKQRHLALSYQHRLNRERQEKLRKIIEAEGIQQFRSLSGIDVLQWRGIEATLELAKSPNSKVIVIGSGAEGLPIILNAQ